MNKILISLVAFILVFVGATSVLAHGGSSGRGEDGDSRVRIEIRAENEAEEDEANEANEFEIRGMATAFTGDTVTINGMVIAINPSLVDEFEQKGTIEVGATVKVEGMVAADGSLLAREIKVEGV